MSPPARNVPRRGAARSKARTVQARQRTGPAAPLHADPGLQPERTVMSWDRTLLALFVAAMMFLRWYPTEGVVTLVPAALCGVGGLIIHVGQRHRYSVQAAGIAQNRVAADVWAVVFLTVLVILLAALGFAAMWWV